MSALLPARPGDGHVGPDLPAPRLQGVLTDAERAARWEVRAAQWRALELAQATFGDATHGTLLGLRTRGELRGLLRLDVPFADLETHRRREAAFLDMVSADPLMGDVPLVFVVGPDGA